MSKKNSEAKKFVLYTVINGGLTVAYYCLYYFFNEYMHCYYMLSNFTSYVITVVAGFIMTKTIVFQSNHWCVQEILKFLGVRGLMLGVNSLALFVTATIFMMNKYVAFFVVNVGCYLLSYSLNKMVFENKSAKKSL